MKKKSLANEWKCKQCGQCCKIFKLPVKNKADLIKAFHAAYGFKLKSYDIEVIFKGECEYLKGNKCTIYNLNKRTQLSCGKKNKDYFCKNYPSAEIPDGQLYKKRCLICNNVRSFQKGTERDRQSVCGNCWVW